VQMVKEGKRKGYWNYDSTKVPEKFIQKESNLDIEDVK